MRTRWNKPKVEDNRPFLFWICPKCRHEVHAKDRPEPIRWTNGHVCYFVQAVEGKGYEKMDS